MKPETSQNTANAARVGSTGGSAPSYEDRMNDRRANGHAWMMCRECGGKLYDFDGHQDSDRPCPYRRNGQCEPR